MSFSRSGHSLLLATFAFATCVQAEPLRKTLEAGGHERVYLVDLPAGYEADKSPLPLVFVFHGGTLGSAAQAERSYGFGALAEKKRFIAVFPDGIDHHWNDGREGELASVRGIDDIAFLSGLLDRLVADYRVDPKRIYAAGISNGAMFSYALALKLNPRFATIGTVAGAIAEPLAANFALKEPVSVIAFHGTVDKIVPASGGKVLGDVGGRVRSVADTVALFVTADGCTSTGAATTLPVHIPDDGTVVHRETYPGGRAGSEVVLYTIDGGGHTWPNGPVNKVYTAIAGPTTQTVDATALIWDFFEQHPKR